MSITKPHTRRIIDGHSIRWNEQEAKQAYAAGHWVKETLADALARSATEQPNRVLIVDGDIQLNAQSLQKKACSLAHTLAARYPAGSVISFMLPNWYEAAIIYLATTIAGMVAHPVLPSLREHDLRFMLKDVNSRMIFIPEKFREHNYTDMLSEIIQNLDHPPEVVVVRGNKDQHIHFDSLFFNSTNQTLPTLNPDAVRMIMYTSGTTGRPKGVMHSHNSIHALIKQLGQHWLIEPGDKFLVASPISHIGGAIYAFECPILLGAQAVLMEQWQADKAVEQIQNQHCTHFAGATPFLVQTLAAAKRAETRLPELKLFICGGASVAPSLIREASDYFERAIVTRVYGSTEVPVMSVGVINRNDIKHAAETDGQAGIADIKLRDANGNFTDSGEVIAKGAQMLVGYHHSEDENQAFDKQGYFRSGDLAHWIDNNYLVISGRIKDLIIRNGENIAPKEIEDLLINHPDINDIAIVGLPNAKTGEQACAVIVTNNKAQTDVNTLAKFLIAKGVTKFKIPERIEIWPSLPKNDAGKILKHQIRNTLIKQTTPN
ncbi:AMP-binding protein [bacterium AH-315-K03]|nr:AMP-binding protein [bacterium AH-315-K03]